jgi:hypothetical protein
MQTDAISCKPVLSDLTLTVRLVDAPGAPRRRGTPAPWLVDALRTGLVAVADPEARPALAGREALRHL